MEKIQVTTTFITTLKDKHILLDTNLFRDSAAKPTIFNDFFNKLKSAGVTLTTIDFVKIEMLKGFSNEDKYKATEKLIMDITDDITIPIQSQTFSTVYELVREYGIEGTALSITDLFLGALLKQYKSNIFLISRDTTDFIQRIFKLVDIINVPHSKGIFTYGVYQYK